MDGGAVAVVAVFVGLAGGEVEGAGDFFVEEDVAHGIEDVRIEAEGEFAGVTGAGISIEDFIEAFGIVRGGVDDFAFFEFEADIFKFRAGIKGRGVKLDRPINGIFYGAREYFAIGDVAVAFAHFCANSFDAEAKVGPRSFDVNAIGFGHEPLQGCHGLGHSAVVHGANVKV